MHSAYGEELDAFRDTVRAFFRKELEPRVKEFERHGTDRAFWQAAGRAGLLGLFVPEAYGGPGEIKTHDLCLRRGLSSAGGRRLYAGTCNAEKLVAWVRSPTTVPQRSPCPTAVAASGRSHPRC